MEEDGKDLTPFWLQSTTNTRRTDRIRNSLSSFFFSSGLLIILLLVTAVSFLVFVIPSTLSFSAQIFRPHTVKKSWDSLNILLVLFALVFGFLSRATNQERNNNEYQTSPISRNEIQKSNPSTPQRKWYDYSTDEAQKSNLSTFQQQWFGYSDQMAYNNANISRGGLRRTSSSLPDLLEASPQVMAGNYPWRFYDDMSVDTYRVSETGQLLRRRSWKDKFEDARVGESTNIYVDTFVNHPKDASNTPRHPSPPPPTSSPPPPSLKPPFPTMPEEKPKRARRSVVRKRERRSKKKDDESENKETISLPVTPPPPPAALPQFVDRKSSKTDNKRSGATATKDFLNSLYHKKKKKQRQKSIENFDALVHQSQTPPLQFQLPPRSGPPPPPPPLPPAPSVFHNLFSSKKSNRKRPDQDISTSTSSSPQPTPPTPAAIPSKPSTSHAVTVITHKSPKPVKIRSFDSVEENSNSGGESPVIPIPPPPPPPPPFAKSLSWKFVVQGDYVRVDSILSSRSGSSDTDDLESDSTPVATDGGDAMTFPPSPLFFPSPDVNAKAENFISKFRAGLKLEKMNSMKKRGGLGLSNLGRGSDSTPL